MEVKIKDRHLAEPIHTLPAFNRAWYGEAFEAYRYRVEVEPWCLAKSKADGKRNNNGTPGTDKPWKKAKSERSPSDPKADSSGAGNSKSGVSDSAGGKSGRAQINPGGITCDVCGSNRHLRRSCNLRSHPGANLSNLPWAQSEMGKAYKQNLEKDWLVSHKKADGTDYVWKSKSNDDITILCHLTDSLSHSHRIENRHLIPMHVSMLQDKSTNAFSILDTGSLQDNFISEELARKLENLVSYHAVVISWSVVHLIRCVVVVKIVEF
jgi:hypothetical protein